MTAIATVSPTVVPENGGTRLLVEGTFAVGVEHWVYLGPTGSLSDSPCFAGSGQGIRAISEDGTTLEVFTPELPAGTANNVFVREVGNPANFDILPDGVRVVHRDYSTSLWSMKALFPPNRRMGFRSMQLMPEPAVPSNQLLWSETFQNPVWTKTDVAAVDGEEDPYGGVRGALLSEGSALASLHGIEQAVGIVSEDDVITVSIYAKAVNRRYVFLGITGGGGCFDLQTGELVDYFEFGARFIGGDIQAVDYLGSSGWYRISSTLRKNFTGVDSVYFFALATPDVPGFSFDGLTQDSIRVAFACLDTWPTVRLYRPTETEPAV